MTPAAPADPYSHPAAAPGSTSKSSTSDGCICSRIPSEDGIRTPSMTTTGGSSSTNERLRPEPRVAVAPTCVGSPLTIPGANRRMSSITDLAPKASISPLSRRRPLPRWRASRSR